MFKRKKKKLEQTKQKTTYKDFALNLLEQNNSSEIGLIRLVYKDTLPAYLLEMNGQTVNRNEYSQLGTIVDGIEGFTVTETQITLPDLRGRFIRGAGADNPLGTTQEDAMRNITGNFQARGSDSFTGGFDKADGVFEKTNFIEKKGFQAENTSTGGKYTNVKMDASTQVPTADENRPVNVALRICIHAKPTIDIDNLEFFDIADFQQVTTLLATDNFVLENNRKIAFSDLQTNLTQSSTPQIEFNNLIEKISSFEYEIATNSLNFSLDTGSLDFNLMKLFKDAHGNCYGARFKNFNHLQTKNPLEPFFKSPITGQNFNKMFIRIELQTSPLSTTNEGHVRCYIRSLKNGETKTFDSKEVSKSPLSFSFNLQTSLKGALDEFITHGFEIRLTSDLKEEMMITSAKATITYMGF